MIGVVSSFDKISFGLIRFDRGDTIVVCGKKCPNFGVLKKYVLWIFRYCKWCNARKKHPVCGRNEQTAAHRYSHCDGFVLTSQIKAFVFMFGLKV